MDDVPEAACPRPPSDSRLQIAPLETPDRTPGVSQGSLVDPQLDEHIGDAMVRQELISHHEDRITPQASW